MDDLNQQPAESANFDDRLASLINVNEGLVDLSQTKQPTPREANGRFAAKADANGYEQPQAAPVEPVKTEDVKPEDKAKVEPAKEAKKADAPAEDEEDFLELPPEKDGEQPTRFKVSEVLAGFQKAKTLETEIETLRTQTRQLPAEIEKELSETVTARQQYLNGLLTMQKMLAVPEPDRDLINPNSPNYSPETFYAQMQRAEQIRGIHQQMTAEAQRAEAEQKEQQTKLHNARIAREMQSLLKDWPEFKDQAVQKKFVTEAAKEYGLTAEEIASVTSARDYQILRDALAYRASKAAKETATAEAVKIVKAKPKLVRGSARQQVDSKASAFNEASDRLGKSHSLEDAAAALRAFV